MTRLVIHGLKGRLKESEELHRRLLVEFKHNSQLKNLVEKLLYHDSNDTVLSESGKNKPFVEIVTEQPKHIIDAMVAAVKAATDGKWGIEIPQKTRCYIKPS